MPRRFRSANNGSGLKLSSLLDYLYVARTDEKKIRNDECDECAIILPFRESLADAMSNNFLVSLGRGIVHKFKEPLKRYHEIST